MLSLPVRRILFFLPLLGLGTEALWHFFQVVLGRIRYPYELEWMEGGMLQQVLRVLHHQPLYGDPSLDFIPALYMPLYYYLCALSAIFLGENLFALRFVSLLASLATSGFIFLIVRHVSRSRLAACLGVLLFAWSFPHTAFWSDVARVDSLWTCLLAATFYCLLRARDCASLPNIIFLATAFFLAFFAKQSSVFLLPFLLLAMLCWTNWRVVLLFCIFFGVASLMLVGILQFTTGGRFIFFAFQMASTHGVSVAGLKIFLRDVLLSVGFITLFSVLYPFLATGSLRDKAGWFFVLAGFIFLSMLSRAYAGAFFNVLMPLYFCLAVFVALVFSLLVEKAILSWRPVIPALLMLFLVSSEMYRHRYDAGKQWPTPASYAAHEELVQRIAAVDGKVCVTSHGYLAWLAGKDFCAHNTQVTDLLTGSDPALAQSLRDEARRKILGGYYRVLVLDREKDLTDLGLQLSAIPYKVTPIHYAHGPLQFPVNGYSPKFWLEFNGPGIQEH